MKKLLKNSILMCVFALAFILCGVSVKAAGLNNTTIEGVSATYKIDEVAHYAINGNAQEHGVVLKAKEKGRYEWTFIIKTFKVYTAQVSVAKCDDYDAGQKYCKTWSVYNYSTDENKTMDALKQDGLVLTFKDELFTPAKGITEINGAKLGTLTTEHKVEDTYFVIVQYRLQTGTLYEPDVFRVVFSNDLEGLNVSASDLGNQTKVTATSGTPIEAIKYFYTSAQLSEGYDFASEYTKAGNGVTEQVNLNAAPSSNDGIFSESVSLEDGQNKYYYVEVTDALGNKMTYDVTKGTTTQNQPSTQPSQNPSDANVANTNVGKIILMSLIVILVISLVLVIIQRIVDYKRKLY